MPSTWLVALLGLVVIVVFFGVLIYLTDRAGDP